MFKRDYERAAEHVRTIRRWGFKPVVVDSVVDAYLHLFRPKKAFNLDKFLVACGYGEEQQS